MAAGVPASGPLVPDVSRIAVLRANALGDYMFSLPAMYSLQAAYPDAELTLLGADWHARVLPGRPGPVHRVVRLPAIPGLTAPAEEAGPGAAGSGDVAGTGVDAGADGIGEFLAWGRRQRFDLAVQLHGGGLHSNPVATALGARVTAGLRADDAPPLDRSVPYVYYHAEVFRYLEVAGLVGAPPVTYRPRFEITDGDLAEARAVLGEPRAGRPRAVLHPGATDPRRRWPAEWFAAVGDALAASGAEVLLTGVRAEREIVDRVCASMRERVRAVVDELSIGGLAGLYAHCALVVANDTGPLHLAEAVGTRTVGLYWIGNMINGAPVDRARHRPLISWTIHCPECGADCTRDLYPARSDGTGCRHAPSFVADIAVAEVVDEAVDLLTDHRRETAAALPR